MLHEWGGQVTVGHGPLTEAEVLLGRLPTLAPPDKLTVFPCGDSWGQVDKLALGCLRTTGAGWPGACLTAL